MRPTLLIVLASLLLVACPTADPDLEVPDISAHYILAADQRDSTCGTTIATADQVTGFLEDSADGVPILNMDLTQEGDALHAVLDPSGCEWTGLVDVQGTFSLSGPCDDADVIREGRVAATASEFGDSWDMEGALTIEVDTLDAAGDPGPDGTADCEAILDLTGHGS